VEKEIDERKKYNEIYAKAKKIQKRSTCKICGKQCSSFCKSHTIPQFILEKLKINNTNYVSTAYWNMTKLSPHVLSPKKGVKEAGVFYEICDKCDNEKFQDYESEGTIIKKPSNRLMMLIALKNFLYLYHKYRIDCLAQEELCSGAINDNVINDSNLNYVNWFDKEINSLIYKLENDREQKYKILFWKKLDYRVPISFQGAITPTFDLNGNQIKTKKSIQSDLHIVVFSLEKESVVFAFYKLKDTEYDGIYKQFNMLTVEQKLEKLNVLLLLYSEDYFMYENIAEKMNDTEKAKFIEIFYGLESSFGNKINEVLKKRREIFQHSNEYPNLLEKKFSLK